MKFSLLVGCCLLSCCIAMPRAAKPVMTEKAVLQGSVQDPDGAAYVCHGCSVSVTGRDFSASSPLEERGTFRFELPPGVYVITTHIPFAYDLRRAAFRLRPGETVTLNLVPRLRLLGTETEVTPGGLKDKEHISPPAEFEEIDVDPKSELRALVEFEGRDTEKRTIIYKNSVLSYDTVAIYADRIEYDKVSRTFDATGGAVVVDVGGTRRITRRVKARLSGNVRCFEYADKE